MTLTIHMAILSETKNKDILYFRLGTKLESSIVMVVNQYIDEIFLVIAVIILNVLVLNIGRV